MGLRHNADFIALCVGGGDAFLIDREEGAILVDGGLKNKSFPDLVRNDGGVGNLDVAVCTHNDADHTGGILALLKEGFPIEELWLPASWAYRLPDLILNPGLMLFELFLELRDRRYIDERGFLNDEAPVEIESIPTSDAVEDIRGSESGTWREGLEELLATHAADEVGTRKEERSLSLADETFPYDRITLEEIDYNLRQNNLYELWRPSQPMPWVYNTLARSSALYESVTQSISNIREIAIWTYHRGIEIRWFEYTPNHPSGGRDDFIPVNCRERSPSFDRRLPALDYVALTVANEQSLVFYAPADEESGGILCTADSLLKDFRDQFPSDPHMLVTTPHHGSETNNGAYPVLQRKTRDEAYWVRSGARHAGWPCDEYIDLPCKKVCTRCRVHPYSDQTVYMKKGQGKWRPTQGTTACRCKSSVTWPDTSSVVCHGECNDGSECRKRTTHESGRCYYHRN